MSYTPLESLDRLGDSLPPGGLKESEADLSSAFKLAAASLAGLYKAGRQSQQQG